MNYADLAFLSAVEQKQAFVEGHTSPSEVLEAQLSRVDSFNYGEEIGVNAFTEVMQNEARESARAASDRYARNRHSSKRSLPTLLGITVATKEKHALAGKAHTQGLMAQRGTSAGVDHPVVARLRAAGAIIHARTTSPEFSCATVTHSPMWGTTRNPWNLRMSPGGSSGGAGAALAAGFTTLATASDIAGSTRIPAAFTGTVGYKAPYGRVPGAGFLAVDWYRGDGPMGRTVEDVALMSSVISGKHSSDANSWGAPGKELLGERKPLDQVHIGVSLDLGDYPVSADVARCFTDAVNLFRASGAKISEIKIPWSTEQIRKTIFAHFGQILAPAMAEIIGNSTEPRAAYTDQFIRDSLEQARTVSLIESLQMDVLVNAQLAAATAEVDVLICPTNAMDWLLADGNYLDGLQIGDRSLAHYWEGHMTSPFNVANQRPVLSIPCGIGANNVPVGLQVVGQTWDESSTFGIAAELERVLEFSNRAELNDSPVFVEG
ncbi:amidase [Arthrobacter sp. MYb211]|uniref:amidase n=1 Tax=unclassified Arthrobacter TaxID=235627 RepID=UPI000CFBEAF5|nr:MULTISPECIES: amidase [unclassified Arthrobacter]PQZ96847.1 amidase [Arthrobacter sp. MYb224]PQZ98021.1 amidase [Arthrobacter sp. MYb229]PRA10050.1 amidase [Arthrobacter sp. MYb221]PRB46903.1 amidase [Arthrobacter sp. MYb216]PRC05241.1 amidase [Arthrobacter sp. MYb211]